MIPRPFLKLQHGVDLPLRNHRHEAFARRVVTGESLTQAYRQVYGTNAKAAGANGARLMKNDSVIRRVGWLQTQSATSAVMTLIQQRQYLARVIRTPIAQVNEESDLCQRFKRTARVYSKAMPDKLCAVKLDCQLAGYLPMRRGRRRNNKP